jgi:hypothetical protein
MQPIITSRQCWSGTVAEADGVTPRQPEILNSGSDDNAAALEQREASGERMSGHRVIVRSATWDALLKEGIAAALLARREDDAGCTPFGQRSSVVGRRLSARMMPAPTAT